jgi:hypothetical protein
LLSLPKVTLDITCWNVAIAQRNSDLFDMLLKRKDIQTIIEPYAKLYFLDLCKQSFPEHQPVMDYLLEKVDEATIIKGWTSSSIGVNQAVLLLLKSPLSFALLRERNALVQSKFIQIARAKEWFYMKEAIELMLSNNLVDPSFQDSIILDSLVNQFQLSLLEKVLQDERINPSARKNSALSCAIHFRLNQFVELLIHHPLFVCDENSLSSLIHHGYLKEAKFLIENNKATPSMALPPAIQFGDWEFIRFLLEKKHADPSYNESSALRAACKKGFLDLAKELLHYPNVDPSVQDNICIRQACFDGFEDIVSHLLNDSRVDPTTCNCQCLRSAIQKNHPHIIQLLLNDSRVKKFEYILEETTEPSSRSTLTSKLKNLFGL